MMMSIPMLHFEGRECHDRDADAIEGVECHDRCDADMLGGASECLPLYTVGNNSKHSFLLAPERDPTEPMVMGGGPSYSSSQSNEFCFCFCFDLSLILKKQCQSRPLLLLLLAPSFFLDGLTLGQQTPAVDRVAAAAAIPLLLLLLLLLGSFHQWNLSTVRQVVVVIADPVLVPHGKESS
jgi:hypothetical protein